MTGAELAYLIFSIVSLFYGGAVVEAETKGAITQSINYEINVTKCEKQYPKIIITDK